MPGMMGNTMQENIGQGISNSQQMLGVQPMGAMQQPLGQMAMNGLPGQNFGTSGLQKFMGAPLGGQVAGVGGLTPPQGMAPPQQGITPTMWDQLASGNIGGI